MAAEMANTRRERWWIERAGVDSGEKMLGMSEGSAAAAATMVSGTRKNARNTSDDAVSAQRSDRALPTLVMHLLYAGVCFICVINLQFAELMRGLHIRRCGWIGCGFCFRVGSV